MYQPKDKTTPLHEHWARATKAFRPSLVRRRPPVRKTTQEPAPTTVQQPPPTQPFGDLNIKENLDRALDFAVTAILKCVVYMLVFVIDAHLNAYPGGGGAQPCM